MVANNSANYQPTQYNVQTGGANNTLNNVAPSATSGVPVISQGSSAQPIFGTAVVAGGGTGVTTMTTAYAPVCAGTTATGALQVASTGLSTSGYVLTSNGASALPSFQAVSGSGFTVINIQIFTSSGTYTPTANMKYCIIECCGGGGGGGGTAQGPVNQWSIGAGGGGGGYSRKFASAATIGASQTVTIGAAGSAGATGNNAGGNGGDTSVGTICIGKGGTGGGGGTGTAGNGITGGAGGVAGTGDISIPGQQGGNTYIGTGVPPQGAGGSSILGFGGVASTTSSTSASGNAGQNYGGGGSGGIFYSTGAGAAGGAGVKGVVIITEYI